MAPLNLSKMRSFTVSQFYNFAILQFRNFNQRYLLIQVTVVYIEKHIFLYCRIKFHCCLYRRCGNKRKACTLRGWFSHGASQRRVVPILVTYTAQRTDNSMTSLCPFHQLRNGMHERKRFSLCIVRFTARLPVWPEVCFFVRLIYSDSRPLRVVSYDVSRSNLHSAGRCSSQQTNWL